jgi:hypothetical protein
LPLDTALYLSLFINPSKSLSIPQPVFPQHLHSPSTSTKTLDEAKRYESEKKEREKSLKAKRHRDTASYIFETGRKESGGQGQGCSQADDGEDDTEPQQGGSRCEQFDYTSFV